MKKKNKWEDHYTIKARKEGYPARSVYKLMEIQNKFKIIKKNSKVIDLGCCPGSWLMYSLQLVKNPDNIIGIDIQKCINEQFSKVKIIQADVNDFDAIKDNISIIKFDVVLSDMAPDTIGMKSIDAYKSFELCNSALKIANDHLKKNGNFVCKNFFGEDSQTFFKSVKQNFKKFKLFKPQSIRKGSNEIYAVGLGKL